MANLGFPVVVYVFIFTLGLLMGSFLNVVVYRLPRGLKVGRGRSFCPHCRKQLKWWELIPLFSFLFLGGRCSKCKKAISWQYPAIELLTGALFVLGAYSLSHRLILVNYLNYYQAIAFYSLLLAFYFIIISCLIAIFFIDLKHYIIPDSLIITGCGASLAYLVLFQTNPYVRQAAGEDIFLRSFFPYIDFHFASSLFINNFLFAIIGGGFFWLIIAATKGKGMGMGDMKLGIFMGLLLGGRLFPALSLAFISGALAGVALILLKGKTFKSQMPFGPFLAGATLIMMLI